MTHPLRAKRPRQGSWARGLVVGSLVSTLAFPQAALAKLDTIVTTEPDAGADAEMERVWELIRTGDARVDAAEYQQAVAAYQEALEILTPRPEWAAQQNMLRSLLAEAHEGVYGIHRNPVHLRKAKVLLEQYIGNLETGSSELGPARRRLEAIEQKLVEIEAAAQQEAAASSDGEVDPSPRPQAQPAATGVDKPPRGPGHPRIVAGSVLTAIGAGALIPTGYFMVKLIDHQQHGREQEDDPNVPQDELDEITADRNQAATLTLISGLAAGAFLATGVALLVTGKRKNRAQKLTVVPAAGGVTVRF
ncbi:MAG: hypothetical protein B7733_01730 [Myxococcales bacterium FL481]|nr:MAG: hypothetical protein B7733_01730 [Myxococcales bacterium FL481]